MTLRTYTTSPPRVMCPGNIIGIIRMREVYGGGAIWHLTYPKKLMIYLGFPTEPEKTEARRTDFSRYFRQLDNPDYIPGALAFVSPQSKV